MRLLGARMAIAVAEENAGRKALADSPLLTARAEEMFSELIAVFSYGRKTLFDVCLYFASCGFSVQEVVSGLKHTAEIIKKEWGKEQEPELFLMIIDDPDDETNRVDVVIRTYLHWKEACQKVDNVALATEDLRSTLNVGILLAPLVE